MATIKDATEAFNKFANGLEGVIKSAIVDNKLQAVDYVQEQLYSGMNGKDKPLRPTYTGDPWFKSEESGRWYMNAKGYLKWKKDITPPLPSYLGFQPRNDNTPNLIITGDFYSSITAIPITDGIRIETRGTSFGSDIEKKYGSVILGLGPSAKKHFVKYVLNPALKKYFAKFGL